MAFETRSSTLILITFYHTLFTLHAHNDVDNSGDETPYSRGDSLKSMPRALRRPETRHWNASYRRMLAYSMLVHVI